jgi:hypothetical protein
MIQILKKTNMKASKNFGPLSDSYLMTLEMRGEKKNEPFYPQMKIEM